MMEGEPVRQPDEETAFIGRKVEAPIRRQRLQQQRAQRKRLAVLTVSSVTILAFGAVGVFLTMPLGTPEEVKTAVSQAMASDPAGATKETVFVPSFTIYDEDGDGKVTLGEYLDRLSINRDAALKRVDESNLDETEKTRISDLLNEDFNKHSDCVSLIAQQHGDEVMTQENFDEVYKAITIKFCPMDDDRIPDAYQLKEIATGQEEPAPIEVDPELFDPTFEGSSSSTSESNSGCVDTATESSGKAEDDESAASEGSASTSTSSTEAEWNPDKPVAPPHPVTKNDDVKVQVGITGSQPSDEKPWRPPFPTDPPIPSTTDTKPSQWTPNEPTDTPVSKKVTPTNNEPEWNPNMPTNPPTVGSPSDNSARSGSSSKEQGREQQTGAYNTYVGAKTTATYDKSPRSESYPEGETQESPFAEQGRDQQTGAYNAYTGGAADTGAYNTYVGAETTATYDKSPRSESYPEGETQESPFAEQGRDQQTGAYNAYTGGAADTGAYNTYVGAETTATYDKSPRSESYPEGETQESPFAEQGREQQTGAYNAYTGGAADTGAYNVRSESDLGFEATTHGSGNGRKQLRGENV